MSKSQDKHLQMASCTHIPKTIPLKDDEMSKRANTPGAAGAVVAKCTECIYDPDMPGTLNDQITGCKCNDCPLWPHRIGAGIADIVVIDPLLTSSDQWQRKVNLVSDLCAKGTKTAALHAYCIDCNYDNHEPGSWRQQINECDTRKCPLWLVRPKSSKGKSHAST